jgi:hypothetical protein
LCVGVAGFEPTTSSSQTRRDTGLRYTPILESECKYRWNFDFATALKKKY